MAIKTPPKKTPPPVDEAAFSRFVEKAPDGAAAKPEKPARPPAAPRVLLDQERSTYKTPEVQPSKKGGEKWAQISLRISAGDLERINAAAVRLDKERAAFIRSAVMRAVIDTEK